MKKRLIALLCAISMLASSAIALADAEGTSPEPAGEITETAGGGEKNESAEKGADVEEDIEEGDEAQNEAEENGAQADVENNEAEGADENAAEAEGTVADTNEAADEENAEENEDAEDEAAVLPAGDAGLMSVSLGAVAPVAVDTANKEELEALVEKANAVTSEMVSSAVFSALESAITTAQAVLDDESALQDDVDEQVEALSAKLQAATDETRDALYEAIYTYVGLDSALLEKNAYAAYDAAHKAAKAAYWKEEKTAAELYTLTKNLKDTYTTAAAANAAVEVILSGNVVTEADKKFYPGMGSDTLPNLSYVYAPGGNPQPATQDANCERLLSGVGATPYDNNPNITWGTWDWNGTTNVDFNLGEEAYITGADFYECPKNGGGSNYLSDKLIVYTSDDGINWTERGSAIPDDTLTPNSIQGTAVDFTNGAVKCRFVRMSIIDSAGYQVLPNEVVIRGYRASQESATPVMIDQIDYKTGGKRFISLDGVTGNINISGIIRNTTDTSKDVKVVMAVCKDGDIIDLTLASKTVDKYSTANFTGRVKSDGDPDAEIITFVWDNFESCTPLSAVTKFGETAHNMATYEKSGEGAEFDIDSERLTVWGKSTKGSAMNDVALLVLKAGTKNTDMEALTLRKQRDAIVYIDQVTPDSSGYYAFESFPINLPSKYGNNNVYVKEQNIDLIAYRLLYLDNAGETALVNDFKGAADAAAMRTVIDNNKFFINGVTAVDEIIAKYDEDTVLDSVSGMILGTSYEDGQELLEEILAAIALTDLNNITDVDEAMASIDRYCEEFGIDKNGLYTKIYSGKDYKKFKKEVTEKYIGKDYANIKAFIADFCERITVDMLNQATNYTDVSKVIFADKDYMDSVGFDIDGYDKLKSSEQTRVLKQVVKKNNFATMTDVKKAFNDAVDNPGSDKTYGSLGGSGGGFSGGSSSLGTSIPMTGITSDDVGAFKDLSSAEWARESILALHKKGIVNGMTANTFAPNDNVTREQFTQMLALAFELLDGTGDCDFNDVAKDAWYYKAIAAAVKNGIVFGVSDRDFGIGMQITREDMAVLAYRALVAKGHKVIYDESQIAEFTDDAMISGYAREAVYAMRGNGIMLGRGDNEFQPKAQATRAEAAKIIYSIMGK